MIIEYHRPHTMEEALSLLGRNAPPTVPMGGGTSLSRYRNQAIAVVDIQALPLHATRVEGQNLKIGAGVKLQALLEDPQTQAVLVEAVRAEASYNLRQMATAGGALVSGGGHSPFAAVCLALDAQLSWEPGGKDVSLGDWLATKKAELPFGALMTQITLPLNARAAYHVVGRSPADVALVLAAAAKWPSGRTRIVIGGRLMERVVLAVDGPDSGGAVEAAVNACSHYFTPRYSLEFIEHEITTLAARCLRDVEVK